MRARQLAAGLVVPALLLGAAACGGSNDKESSKTAQQIYTDATQSLSTAKSVRAKASGQDKDVGGHFDGTVDVEEPNKAYVTLDAAKGASAQIIEIGKDVYLKGNDALWQAVGGSSGPQLGQLAHGKWLKLPAQAGSDFSSFTDPKQLLTADFDGKGALTKVGTKTVDGTKSVGVKDSKGSVLWVDVTNGRPVQFVDKGDSAGPVTFDFSDWNSVTKDISAPKDVVDLQKLLGG